MPSKQFALDERTTVTIVKRSSSRSLRLSITAKGEVRVSMPTWLPYAAGLKFAKTRMSWIQEHLTPPVILKHGQIIGKTHSMSFIASPTAKRVASRIVQPDIIIKYPADLDPSSEAVQTVAKAAAVRALRSQAERLLPPRLQELATEHGYTYGSVSVKQLVSRWGSCDQNKDIVLNLYLMQLPWACIDYVLLHELTHTEIMHHDAAFWGRMAEVVPKLKAVRKLMRHYQPVLRSTEA